MAEWCSFTSDPAPCGAHRCSRHERARSVSWRLRGASAGIDGEGHDDFSVAKRPRTFDRILQINLVEDLVQVRRQSRQGNFPELVIAKVSVAEQVS